MLVASLAAIAGLLIWASLDRGPVPPAANLQLNLGELTGSVGHSIYGKPTAVLFIAGAPTTKAVGDFARMLPDARWDEPGIVSIFGEEFPVLWAAGDSAVWAAHALPGGFTIESGQDESGDYYDIHAGELSNEDLLALRGQQALAVVMLDNDLLVKADAPFLTEESTDDDPFAPQ